jgi:cytochrome P450
VAFTPEHDIHRNRRAALAPFFSRRTVVQLESNIAAKVQTLCDRFSGFAKTSEVVRLDGAYSALTTDVITDYCFGKAYGYLNEHDFKID